LPFLRGLLLLLGRRLRTVHLFFFLQFLVAAPTANRLCEVGRRRAFRLVFCVLHCLSRQWW
jgi:hypothetical protein